MLDLILFGVWSLVCVVVGAWLQHRKLIGASPMPSFGRWEQESREDEDTSPAPQRKGKL
jgi:hypothetical protein